MLHWVALTDGLERHLDVQVAPIRVGERGVGVVFERFYRVDKGRSRDIGGTGLGLAIVCHIAEAHGERVSVESVLDKGTTFILELRSTDRLNCCISVLFLNFTLSV
tara:strand:+ start:303 stop:620 length:318 start_codon:yes stop_codon:yes gene_type:complete